MSSIIITSTPVITPSEYISKSEFFMELSIVNFRCHSSITLSLPSWGIFLLQGPSGSGKTTIYRALDWLVRGHKETVTPLNKSNATKSSVSLKIGDEVTIKRSNNPRELVYTDPTGTYVDSVAQELVYRYFNRNGTYYLEQRSFHTLITMSDSMKKDLLLSCFFNGTNPNKWPTEITSKISTMNKLVGEKVASAETLSQCAGDYAEPAGLTMDDIVRYNGELQQVEEQEELVRTKISELEVHESKWQELCVRINELEGRWVRVVRDIECCKFDPNSVSVDDSHLTGMDSIVCALSQYNHHTAVSIDTLNSKLKSIASKIRDKKEVASYKKSNILDTNNIQQSKVDAIENQIKSLQARRSTVQRNIKAIESQIKSVNMDIDSVNSSISMSVGESEYQDCVARKHRHQALSNIVSKTCKKHSLEPNKQVVERRIRTLETKIIKDTKSHSAEIDRVSGALNSNSHYSREYRTLSHKACEMNDSIATKTKCMLGAESRVAELQENKASTETLLSKLEVDYANSNGIKLKCPCCTEDVIYFNHQLIKPNPDLQPNSNANQSNITSLRTNLSRITNSLTQATRVVESCRTEISGLQVRVSEMNERIEHLKSQIDTTVSDRMLEELRAQQNDHMKHITQITELKSLEWPEDLGDVDVIISQYELNVKYNRLIAEVNSLLSRLEESKSHRSSVDQEIESKVSELNSIRDTTLQVKSELRTIEQQLHTDCVELEHEAKVVRTKIRLASDYLKTKRYQSNLARWLCGVLTTNSQREKERIQRAKDQLAKHEERVGLLNHIDRELQSARCSEYMVSKAQELLDNKTQLTSIKQRVEVCRVLEMCSTLLAQYDAIDEEVCQLDSKIALYAEVLEFVNSYNEHIIRDTIIKINSILSVLIPHVLDKPITIEMSHIKKLKNGSERKTICWRVINQGKEVSFNSISTGEQERVSFCVALAVSLINGDRIIIMDEPMSNIGEDDKSKCLSLIVADEETNPAYGVIGEMLRRVTIIISGYDVPVRSVNGELTIG